MPELFLAQATSPRTTLQIKPHTFRRRLRSLSSSSRHRWLTARKKSALATTTDKTTYFWVPHAIAVRLWPPSQLKKSGLLTITDKTTLSGTACDYFTALAAIAAHEERFSDHRNKRSTDNSELEYTKPLLYNNKTATSR